MFTHKDLIYHRGLHGYVEQRGRIVQISENSLEAFQASIDAGASMVEFDARINPLGASRPPIIAHDPFSLGKVPTIVDTFDLIDGKCDVNIDIKDPRIWKEVLETVTRHILYGGWRHDLFIISLFDHPTAVLVKRHYPHLRVGVIMDGIPLNSYVTTLHKMGIDNLHMEYMNADMDTQHDRTFMKHATKLGMRVWVWTVNDLATAKRVYDWGAERIFTDKPHLFPD